jgi:tetratricopeptide (TPR) repeat protein
MPGDIINRFGYEFPVARSEFRIGFEGPFNNFIRIFILAHDLPEAINNGLNERLVKFHLLQNYELKRIGNDDGGIVNFIKFIPMRLKLLTLLAFLSAFGLAQKHQKFLEEGMRLMNEEKYEPALAEFKKAIAANPKFAESYYQRGRCYMNLGKFTDARTDLGLAIDLDSKKAAYYNLRGIACENLNDTVNALKDYSTAVLVNNTDPAAFANLSRISAAQGKQQDALGQINTAIRLGPKEKSYYVSKGDLLQALKDTSGAINAYKEALNSDSSFYAANYALAILYNEKEKFKEALMYVERAISTEVNNPEGYVEKGLILENMKDSVGALKNYNKALELDKNFSFAYFTRGNYYQAHGNSTAAIADFSKLISLDPNDADAYISRAECYSDTDNCAQAIIDLEAAKKINPNDPEIYFQIGICQDETRYFREAIESFNKAITIDSLNSSYYYSRGNSYYILEQLDLAQKDYFKALKVDSTNTGAYFNLGNIHFDRKEFDKAIPYYDKYLKMEPKDADAMVNRGICKQGLGNNKEACEDWKTASAAGNFEAKENLKKFCK